MKAYQEVEIYLSVGGDYCAFHEMYFSVAADITNNIVFEDHTFDTDAEFFEYLKDYKFEDYCDYTHCKAIKIGDNYFYNINI